ncbi:MAG: hypothetical protein Q7R45_13245, partial [Sulfuricaulis sp.]|nr:hypothetical protein [Sulfuricaulis sp.]
TPFSQLIAQPFDVLDHELAVWRRYALKQRRGPAPWLRTEFFSSARAPPPISSSNLSKASGKPDKRRPGA